MSVYKETCFFVAKSFRSLLVVVGFVAKKMNILIILAAIASGGVCHLHSDHQYSTEPTVYIQESTVPPKTVNHYTTVSSLGVPAAHYTHGSSSFGSHLSHPTTYTGSAKTFGSAKSFSSFPSYESYSRSYQPSAQHVFSKPYSSFVTTPSYSTTVSPTYSTIFSTPRSSVFNSGVYSTQATPVSSYPTSYSTPTVSTYSSSFPSYGTSKPTVSYPAYSTSVSSSSSPFAKVFSTPATVTTSYPSVSAFKSTFSPNYNVYSTASPQVYKDSSKPVITQFSSPGSWSSQGTAHGFSSSVNAPVTIQKSTSFTPIKPTLTAYSTPVTLYPFSGQYSTAIKNQGSQYSTNYSPGVNVVGKTVYTKPAYNSYSSISSVPSSYSAPVAFSSHPTVQSVIVPSVSAYSSPVTSHGSLASRFAFPSTSQVVSESVYNVNPHSQFTYTLQNAPLAREYHTLEAPHAHSWRTSNTWSSLPLHEQVYVV